MQITALCLFSLAAGCQSVDGDRDGWEEWVGLVSIVTALQSSKGPAGYIRSRDCLLI